jgi:hypothetical protein
MKLRGMIVVVGALLVGCAPSIKTEMLTPSPSDRVYSKDEVVVYQEKDSIPEYTAVAVLKGEGDASVSSKKSVTDALRKKAGELGANAIIILQGKNILEKIDKLVRDVAGGEEGVDHTAALGTF